MRVGRVKCWSKDGRDAGCVKSDLSPEMRVSVGGLIKCVGTLADVSLKRGQERCAHFVHTNVQCSRERPE